MSSGSVIGANEYDDKMPSIPRSTEIFLAMAGLNFALLPVGELLPRMLLGSPWHSCITTLLVARLRLRLLHLHCPHTFPVIDNSIPKTDDTK